MLNGDINLEYMLQGCRCNDRNSQRKLYEHFYGYAMNICLRFSKNREEAVEILNDGFLKALTHIEQYDSFYPFKSWLRRILINSAVDYHRKNIHLPEFSELTSTNGVSADEMPMPQISPDEDVLPVLQKLSPAYRMVFNLYVMEGFKHEEIAVMLGISVGTSRSNLLRAKKILRKIMTEHEFNTLKTNRI